MPAGDVPGEYYHPTQPIPVNTPPLSRVSHDLRRHRRRRGHHARACRGLPRDVGQGRRLPQLRHLHAVLLPQAAGTPPRSTIQLPGGTGGVNWGGPAADPTTGLVYVNAQDTSLVGWVERKETTESYSFDANSSDQPYDRASVNGKGPFFSFSAPLSGQYDAQGRAQGPQAPCYKPPWGELVAVDASTGAIKWSVPLGVIDELPEGKRLVGNSGSAGPDGHRRRPGVRRRDQRPALPRLRRCDRPAAVGSPAARQRQRQPDDLSRARAENSTSPSMPVARSSRIRYPGRDTKRERLSGDEKSFPFSQPPRQRSSWPAPARRSRRPARSSRPSSPSASTASRTSTACGRR